MERDSTGAPDAGQPESLAQLVAAREMVVNQARKGGRRSEIIAAAEQAADLIQYRLSERQIAAAGGDREALIAVKRFLFNAAADCWPGWAADAETYSDAELGRALALARRSADLVDRLGLGPMEQGTAQWLIGAFELSLRHTDAALDYFSRAQVHYERAAAPGLVLLARGYGAIAHEVAGRAPSQGVGSLTETLEALTSGDVEDGDDLRDQLVMAHRIFA